MDNELLRFPYARLYSRPLSHLIFGVRGWFGGYTQWCLRLTPGSAFWDQAKVDRIRIGSALIPVLALRVPPSHILTNKLFLFLFCFSFFFGGGGGGRW